MTSTLDAFDHPSVTRDEARTARAGFSAVPNLAVGSFTFSRGRFHATMRLTPNGAPITLSAPTITALVMDALRIYEASGLASQEAA